MVGNFLLCHKGFDYTTINLKCRSFGGVTSVYYYTQHNNTKYIIYEKSIFDF